MIQFINKGGGGAAAPNLNIFMQAEEPVTKEGIWIKKAGTYNKVIIDDNAKTDPTYKFINMGTQISNVNDNVTRQFAVGNKLYVVGVGTDYKTIVEIDIATNSITNQTTIPSSGEYWGAAARVGDYIYIFNNNDGDNHVYTYDINTHAVTDIGGVTIPFATPNINAIAVGTNIYIIGGANYPQDESNYKFDTLTKTFSKLTNIPNRHNIINLATDGTDIYIYMTTIGSSDNYKCYKYIIATDQYETIENINVVPQVTGYLNGLLYLITNSGTYTHNIETNTLTDLGISPIKNSSCKSTNGLDSTNNIVYYGSGNTINTLEFPTKTYEADSIVIYQGNLYATQLMNTPEGTEGRLLNNFIDVWHNTADGLDKQTSVAYGTGEAWVDIR